MAISDHAISDRAISAPEDDVVVVISAAGRVFASDRPATGVQAFDSPSVLAYALDGPAGSALGMDGLTALVTLYDSAAASVAAGDGPT